MDDTAADVVGASEACVLLDKDRDSARVSSALTCCCCCVTGGRSRARAEPGREPIRRTSGCDAVCLWRTKRVGHVEHVPDEWVLHVSAAMEEERRDIMLGLRHG